MRSNILFFIVLFSLNMFCLFAQKKTIDKYLRTWKIDPNTAGVDSLLPDTAHLNFQLLNHIDQYSVSNAFRGNLGSPIQSKVFTDRVLSHDFIFADAYYPYIRQIESAVFYDTNVPYSSLYYLSGGTNYQEDEQFRFLFTVNPNKKLNIGTTLDYLFARGEYKNLATNRFAGSLFATYNGNRYKFTAHASSNTLNSFENGGIEDVKYITGNVRYDPLNIPVNIEGYSKFKHNQLYYNHQYNLGFERNDTINKDSVVQSWVPVTVFAHTLQVDDLQKWYYEKSVEKQFYKNTYLNKAFTNDTASLLLISNRFSVSMSEEFNKWLNFGLTAYIDNKLEQYGFLTDTVLNSDFQSNTKIGGILSKNRSKVFKFNINGEFTVLGPKIGDFLLHANLGGYFNLWKQKIELEAKGYVKSQTPSFFYNYYQSNHFRWSNDFDKTYTTHLEGKFSIPTQSLSLKVSVENIAKHIYFDGNALPAQQDGNTQVVVAGLSKDFHLGKFSLENIAIYQLSSHQEIIPLPDLVLYHNLYYHDIWFKVLSIQTGVDLRYHTEYFAPAYMPATGQFHNQSVMKTGNYPQFNVYLNAHLKRTRFFVQYYHINQLFMRGNYYSIPGYPINPATLKIGLSWNFYD